MGGLKKLHRTLNFMGGVDDNKSRIDALESQLKAQQNQNQMSTVRVESQQAGVENQRINNNSGSSATFLTGDTALLTDSQKKKKTLLGEA